MFKSAQLVGPQNGAFLVPVLLILPKGGVFPGYPSSFPSWVLPVCPSSPPQGGVFQVCPTSSHSGWSLSSLPHQFPLRVRSFKSAPLVPTQGGVFPVFPTSSHWGGVFQVYPTSSHSGWCLSSLSTSFHSR